MLNCTKSVNVKLGFHVFKDSDEEERRRPTDENQEQDNIQLRREDSRRTEDSPSESDQVRNDVPLRDSDEDTGDENKKRGVDFVSATDKSVNRWDSIIKVSANEWKYTHNFQALT